MKTFPAFLAVCLAFVQLPAAASTLFVDLNCANPTPPYSDWSTAATNIQDAIDAASAGDTVLVTNGVYATGGRVMVSITNRVALNKAINVQSVNGPYVTIIQGGGVNNSPSAVRCAWLTNGASLTGFTLRYGAVNPADGYGGGVASYTNAIVANCIICSNTASSGGGAYQGTLESCAIFGNNASLGSGTYNSTLNSCTVVTNFGSYGVYAQGPTPSWGFTNCIVYNNSGGNYSVSPGNIFSYCCINPLPSGGVGNFTTAPQLFVDNIHLLPGSPCIGAGTNLTSGTDIDGLAWSNPPCVGCSQWRSVPVVTPPLIQFTGNGFTITSAAGGITPINYWWLQNGTPLQNNGHFSSTQTTNLVATNILYSDGGNYQLVASNHFGAVTGLVAQVAIHCVDAAGTNPVAPYLTWATAATNIQDAIDAANAGDAVMVTNGLYATGGRLMGIAGGWTTNRVAVNKAIAVQSVNGPWVTTIQGGGMNNGPSAVRCAWLTNGAALTGFTVRYGATTSGSQDFYGGGAACYTNAIVANCIIYSNTAYWGGGTFQGTLKNCDVYGNYAVNNGAGIDSSTLVNCSVVNDFGSAGVYVAGSPSPSCTFTNCIVYNNTNGNYSGPSGAFSYCCTYPLPSGGVGNFTNAPQFYVDNIHLMSSSPCINSGASVTFGTDIFGQTWANPPSVGCCQWQPAPLAAQPVFQLTGDPPGISVSALTTWGGSVTFWWLENGTPLQNNGNFSSTQTTNLMITNVLFSDAGNYQLVVSNSFGVVTSAVAQVVIHCVDAAGTNPVAPYSTWATAATNIQDAVDVATTNEIVLVTNGVYMFGGRSMDGIITNRVAITRPMLVQSVNGQTASTIQGVGSRNDSSGLSAVRCVWMTNGAMLNGFTISGGGTRQVSSGSGSQYTGAGIFGLTTNYSARVYNCTITNNTACYSCGGAYQVTLNNCTLIGNWVENINYPAEGNYGGGAGNCCLTNCLVMGNATYKDGGGVYGGVLVNCAVTGNLASYGGGIYQAKAVNCTLSGNQTSASGAADGSFLTNCITYGNINVAPNPISTNYYNCTLSYCDTDPLPSGTGNIGVDPQLLADDIHLASTSPCIGKGLNIAAVGTDLYGSAWKNPPSMGCYEWQPQPVFAVQPYFQLLPASRQFNAIASIAGQPPFNCQWSKDGTVVQDDLHYGGSATPALVMSNFLWSDAGAYQIVVSNSLGAVTSQVAQVVIHLVDAAGTNPAPPYTTWATAATNIQDAVDVALPHELVLVTNGVYAYGGQYYSNNPQFSLDRVLVTQPNVAVISVNGYDSTIIQGGPLARCCFLANNDVSLSGFTLQGGAPAWPSVDVRGGGVCSDRQYSGGAKGDVYNCLITGNSASYGGGTAYVNLHNCIISQNVSSYGGGVYDCNLTNCTVSGNNLLQSGGGIYLDSQFYGYVYNSIIFNNGPGSDFVFGFGQDVIRYSCGSSATVHGLGDTNANPQFMDSAFHLSATSPCRGAGSSLYSSGTDIDGKAWSNPPSMGAYEVYDSDFTGPLSVTIQSPQDSAYVGRSWNFTGLITGRAATLVWDWGDGSISNNVSYFTAHVWTNAGDYTVTFTAYNTDNPSGVSTNMLVHVLPLNPPQLQSLGMAMAGTNGFQLQFNSQTGAVYSLQMATNLAPPISWQTLQSITGSGDVLQIGDTNATNLQEFYRIGVK